MAEQTEQTHGQSKSKGTSDGLLLRRVASCLHLSIRLLIVTRFILRSIAHSIGDCLGRFRCPVLSFALWPPPHAEQPAGVELTYYDRTY